MKANLFINFYVDNHPLRDLELDKCLVKNVLNKEIDRIIVVLTRKDLIHLNKVLEKYDTTKVYTIINEERPSYNYYFRLTREYPYDINIIANTDIVMDDDSLKLLKTWNWRNYCLALSRWDYLNHEMSKHISRLYDHRDSQDTWILRGGFKDNKLADFCLGKKGCDNRIAHELSKFYNVINPSRSIMTFHYHITNIKNYAPHGNPKDLVKPPYKLIETSKLPL